MVQIATRRHGKYIANIYFNNTNILLLDKFANIVPTGTIIDIFDIILRIHVHFQLCFQN